jgi:sugar lactone lactonase YvrE
MHLTYFLPVFFALFQATQSQDVVASWVTIDYDWASDAERLAALANGTYIPSQNAITGIKVYGDRIFVTVPRWRKGVPATMNELSHDKKTLIPYPSWAKNAIGDCNALQFSQSMEINPRDGTMWIIDVGSVNTQDADGRVSHCPPKLMIIDLAKDSVQLSFNFPSSVVSPGKNFLNDIVIDPELQRAYISNPGESSVVVFDKISRVSWKVMHPSMSFEPNATEIIVNGEMYDNEVGIDGIALSPDYKILYYSSLNGKKLHSIPCSALTNDVSDATLEEKHKVVLEKSSQADGMIWSQNSLYFGSLPTNQVLKWSGIDSKVEGVVSDADTMQWPDTFAIDEKQNLWFTTNKLQQFFSKPPTMRFDNASNPNFRILRVHIGEKSYLASLSPASLASLSVVMLTFIALKFM